MKCSYWRALRLFLEGSFKADTGMKAERKSDNSGIPAAGILHPVPAFSD
jgi:hypothetical protein